MFNSECTEEQAQMIAKKLFSRFDTNKNNLLDREEVKSMMIEAYNGVNQTIKPTQGDVEGYFRSFDENQDNQINYNDIESFAIRILAGDPNRLNGFKESYSQYLAPTQNNQNPRQFLTSNQEEYNNYATSSQQINYNRQQAQFGTENVNLYSQNKYQQQQLQSNENIYSTVQNNTSSYSQQQFATQQTNFIEQSFGKNQAPQPQYNQMVQRLIDVIRALFIKYDVNNSNYISQDEVGQLLRDTYSQQKINFNPTEEDLKIWMRMNDKDNDGKVTFEEFKNGVIKSLEDAGLNLY